MTTWSLHPVKLHTASRKLRRRRIQARLCACASQCSFIAAKSQLFFSRFKSLEAVQTASRIITNGARIILRLPDFFFFIGIKRIEAVRIEIKVKISNFHSVHACMSIETIFLCCTNTNEDQIFIFFKFWTVLFASLFFILHKEAGGSRLIRTNNIKLTF